MTPVATTRCGGVFTAVARGEDIPFAPPSGAACAFAQDTDVSGVQGSSVSIGGAGQAAWAACCALCNAAPASCGAAVFFEGTCYLKDFGGSLVHNPGRVACVPS